MKALWVGALLVCAGVGAARAEPMAPDEPGPEAAMQTYFAGEKRGGLVLVGMGAVGLGAGAVLATRNSDLARGAGYATLGFGVVHAAAGVFVYVASNGRIGTFKSEIARDPAGFRGRESVRVRGVKKQFLGLKIAESALVVGGAGAVVFGLSTDRDLVAGIGLGIAIEAAATLVFDIVADRRADRYLGALRVAIVPDATGALRPTLAIGSQF